jgi:hypothetical protein
MVVVAAAAAARIKMITTMCEFRSVSTFYVLPGFHADSNAEGLSCQDSYKYSRVL